MKVKATKQGYLGKIREAGDVFEVPDGLKASWFKPVEKAEAEAAKSETAAQKKAREKAEAEAAKQDKPDEQE